MIALLEFFLFDLFICKRLDNADPGLSILKARIDITDFFSVFHKGALHLLILSEREEEHQDHKYDQRKSQLLIN